MPKPASTQPLRDNARVLGASMVGTVVEYYDFYIYAVAAAMFFGPLFFPAQSPAAQTLLSLMTFALAFIARPLGAILFGHFGDRVGRKSTLVVSLILMGGCTFAIAFLPTFDQASAWGLGWLGPTALCLLRFGQGLGLGGEWAGAALLSTENAPPGWRARFGATPPLGTAIGHMIAIGVFLILEVSLTPEELMSWGWRLPFLASAMLVAIGMWVRFNIGETAEFQAALAQEPPPRVPIAKVFGQHPRAILAGTCAVICPFAIVFVVMTYALARGTGPLGFDRHTFLFVQVFASVFTLIGIVLAATRADRTTPASTIAIGGVAAILMGVVFGPGLESGSLLMAAAVICLADFVRGLCMAPMGGWLSSIFPVHLRYSGVAFAFNAGGLIGGGLMPIFAQMMAASGLASNVGLLLSVAGLLSLAGVKLVRPSGLERQPTIVVEA